MKHKLKIPRGKRGVAAILAVSLTIGTIAYARPAWYWNEAWTETAQWQDMSFSPEYTQEIVNEGAIPSGLSMEATFTDKKKPMDEFFSFSKFWLSNRKGQAKTIEKKLEGSGTPVSIDMTQFDNAYCSCIADHINDYPQNSVAFFGGQMALVGVYLPTDELQDYPKPIAESQYFSVENKKMGFSE